jgi:2-dehydro-3-deoxyphosphogluconate aldolase/(4S)-4-hydroxy-2-oxoglutarate aldolase
MRTVTDLPSGGLSSIVAAAPVIPVVVVEDRAAAVPLAQALCRGGLRVIEITLRTEAALDVIAAIAAEVEEAVVGAGTVLTGAQFAAAEKAGARFMVSPGASSGVLAAAADSRVPLMPGAATPSEAMALSEAGYAIQKFFPAGPAGGVAYLKALAAPLPAVRFCPTGGIDAKNAGEYLALPNVVAVGGSWVAPAGALRDGDWPQIERLAREAATLRTAA